MPDLQIRPATAEDLPFLWEMLYFAASMHRGETEDRTAPMRDPELAPYLERWMLDRDLGVVAEQDGQKVGAAWLRIRKGEFATKAYIDDLTPELVIAVYPEFSGQGIGQQLLESLIEEGRQKYQYPAITLSVRTHNPAVKLYQKTGFVVLKEVENRVGGVSVVMVKTLSPATGGRHV